MGGGREHGGDRIRSDVLDHLVVPGEAQMRQHWLQVAEELRHGLVGLAVGCDGREIEVRVAGEQP